MNKPCEGCAFSEGAAANQEPYNALRAQVCALGGIPFYCHHDMDWLGSGKRTFTREEARQLKMCGGWQREVNRLAKSGYFKRASHFIMRGLAMAALDSIEIFVSTTDRDDKEHERKVIDRALARLVNLRDKPV